MTPSMWNSRQNYKNYFIFQNICLEIMGIIYFLLTMISILHSQMVALVDNFAITLVCFIVFPYKDLALMKDFRRAWFVVRLIFRIIILVGVISIQEDQISNIIIQCFWINTARFSIVCCCNLALSRMLRRISHTFPSCSIYYNRVGDKRIFMFYYPCNTIIRYFATIANRECASSFPSPCISCVTCYNLGSSRAINIYCFAVYDTPA